MQIDVNGTTLWFDVDGASLVPDGALMRERPTVVLLHGGPGSFDHSYFKPDFARLAEAAQVVYLDLRGHGRSVWGRPDDWQFETCADDVRAFCDALGIAGPIVLGHSLGGCVAMLYGARHPGHARALILQSTFGRFELNRVVEDFRSAGGDEIAAIVERVYGGDRASVTAEEWARCWRLFGPGVVGPQERARVVANMDTERAGPRIDAKLRRPRPTRSHRLPNARMRGRNRPHYSRRSRPRDMRFAATGRRKAGNSGRRGTLPMERRSGPILDVADRVCVRGLTRKGREWLNL